MKFDRIDKLGEAKTAALSGSYETALKVVDLILNRFPDDIDALRLKGNIIELWISAEFDAIPTAGSNARLSLARACYEKILTIDSRNTLALKDLADHLKDLGEKTEALILYKKLIGILRIDSANGCDVADELREALDESDV